MKTIKIFPVLLLLSLPGIVLSGQPQKHYHSAANKDSATAFVDSYYEHLRAGMSRKQIRSYWLDGELETMDATVDRIAEIRKSKVDIEYQRVLDLLHTTSKCEENRLLKVSVFGRNTRFAKLNYEVRNTCVNPDVVNARAIELSWSRSSDSWLIKSIFDKG